MLRRDSLNESEFVIGSPRHTYLGTELKYVSGPSSDLARSSGCDSVPVGDSYAKSKFVKGFAWGTKPGQS